MYRMYIVLVYYRTTGLQGYRYLSLNSYIPPPRARWLARTDGQADERPGALHTFLALQSVRS